MQGAETLPVACPSSIHSFQAILSASHLDKPLIHGSLCDKAEDGAALGRWPQLVTPADGLQVGLGVPVRIMDECAADCRKVCAQATAACCLHEDKSLPAQSRPTQRNWAFPGVLQCTSLCKDAELWRHAKVCIYFPQGCVPILHRQWDDLCFTKPGDLLI